MRMIAALYVEGQLLLDVQKGREAYSLKQAKAIEGLSIGFKVVEALKGQEKSLRLLTKIVLVEVSLVTLPANPTGARYNFSLKHSYKKSGDMMTIELATLDTLVQAFQVHKMEADTRLNALGAY